MASAKRAIFLIVDPGPAHIAKKTRAFVDSQHGRLRLFFLPPYSPDRNPDELVWKHLKADTVGRMTITDKADFKASRAHPCANYKTTRKNPVLLKNHGSNMPPESAFTYGLINNRAPLESIQHGPQASVGRGSCYRALRETWRGSRSPLHQTAGDLTAKLGCRLLIRNQAD